MKTTLTMDTSEQKLTLGIDWKNIIRTEGLWPMAASRLAALRASSTR